MSNKNLDYVNPYPSVAALYKSGMDSIINCLTASSSSSAAGCDCNDVSIEGIINCTCDFLIATFGNSAANTVSKINLKAGVTNAVNGYLDYGNSLNGILDELQAVPVSSIANLFDRFDQTVGASRVLKGPIANKQLALSIGRASFEYWKAKVNVPPGASPWSPFLDGDKAIDTASIPYWVVAAMFGSQFNFNQDNAIDSDAVAYAPVGSLGGALAVSAGKIILGLVSKECCWGDPHENLNAKFIGDTLLNDFNKSRSFGGNRPIHRPGGILRQEPTESRPTSTPAGNGHMLCEIVHDYYDKDGKWQWDYVESWFQ